MKVKEEHGREKKERNKENTDSEAEAPVVLSSAGSPGLPVSTAEEGRKRSTEKPTGGSPGDVGAAIQDAARGAAKGAAQGPAEVNQEVAVEVPAKAALKASSEADREAVKEAAEGAAKEALREPPVSPTNNFNSCRDLLKHFEQLNINPSETPEGATPAPSHGALKEKENKEDNIDSKDRDVMGPTKGAKETKDQWKEDETNFDDRRQTWRPAPKDDDSSGDELANTKSARPLQRPTSAERDRQPAESSSDEESDSDEDESDPVGPMLAQIRITCQHFQTVYDEPKLTARNPVLHHGAPFGLRPRGPEEAGAAGATGADGVTVNVMAMARDPAVAGDPLIDFKMDVFPHQPLPALREDTLAEFLGPPSTDMECTTLTDQDLDMINDVLAWENTHHIPDSGNTSPGVATPPRTPDDGEGSPASRVSVDNLHSDSPGGDSGLGPHSSPGDITDSPDPTSSTSPHSPWLPDSPVSHITELPRPEPPPPEPGRILGELPRENHKWMRLQIGAAYDPTSHYSFVDVDGTHLIQYLKAAEARPRVELRDLKLIYEAGRCYADGHIALLYTKDEDKCTALYYAAKLKSHHQIAGFVAECLVEVQEKNKTIPKAKQYQIADERFGERGDNIFHCLARWHRADNNFIQVAYTLKNIPGLVKLLDVPNRDNHLPEDCTTSIDMKVMLCSQRRPAELLLNNQYSTMPMQYPNHTAYHTAYVSPMVHPMALPNDPQQYPSLPALYSIMPPEGSQAIAGLHHIAHAPAHHVLNSASRHDGGFLHHS